jgi:hypothetical protein
MTQLIERIREGPKLSSATVLDPLVGPDCRCEARLGWQQPATNGPW